MSDRIIIIIDNERYFLFNYRINYPERHVFR